MTDDARRLRRTQLLAGIILGVIVGTVHALAMHVASRVEPAVTAAAPVSWQSTGADDAAR
ncbi:MAG: hypothetical protein IT183_13635 [Acidobacteria bacterium]|jgi:hypothetical protein|nr:hypothetical protein [Acidobacteriota bacterium]